MPNASVTSEPQTRPPFGESYVRPPAMGSEARFLGESGIPPFFRTFLAFDRKPRKEVSGQAENTSHMTGGFQARGRSDRPVAPARAS